MKRRELRQCMEQLAEERGFRWADKSKRFLGIYRGIVVEVSEWQGEVAFKFISPTAQIGDQILEGFAAFEHVAEAGIPTSWINGLMERDANGREHASDRGCGLSIDTDRIDSIGVDTFKQIPDLVADDLTAHGAVETLPCANCDEKEATTVGVLNYAYTPMCDDCWQALHFHTMGGKLATDQSVNWLLVIPVLAVLTALGGLAWGFLQQPHVADILGFWLLLFPAVWAFGICWATGYVSGGVTRMLRLALFTSVILSVLVGNIWGFRSFVMQQMVDQANHPVIGPDWMESTSLYFAALPNSWEGEVPYLLAGLVGAWVGLRLLKSAETIDVD